MKTNDLIDFAKITVFLIVLMIFAHWLYFGPLSFIPDNIYINGDEYAR